MTRRLIAIVAVLVNIVACNTSMSAEGNTAMQLSTNNAGCFCSDCEAGFRCLLKDNYTTDELAAMGVDHIDTFNYRQIARQVTTTNDD